MSNVDALLVLYNSKLYIFGFRAAVWTKRDILKISPWPPETSDLHFLLFLLILNQKEGKK